ncbi:MAG: DUF2007 domain-containing protein [Deltaproteobacteria bacterium]|nr:MAG: DUF2007 domain-containing protein [Deltaproteobacteria bacterium]
MALVPEPPGSVHEEELKEVLSTSNPGEIALIKSLLEAENIPYLAQGENFSAVRAPIPVRFMIPSEHIERAREVLADLL